MIEVECNECGENEEYSTHSQVSLWATFHILGTGHDQGVTITEDLEEIDMKIKVGDVDD